LEAHKFADLAPHIAKVKGAATETHEDCLRIMRKAEIIMVKEIRAGQALGQIAEKGAVESAGDPGILAEGNARDP
jgi:hypothetical protein